MIQDRDMLWYHIKLKNTQTRERWGEEKFDMKLNFIIHSVKCTLFPIYT